MTPKDIWRKWEFTAADFKTMHGFHISDVVIAANAKLLKLFEGSKVVHGFTYNGKETDWREGQPNFPGITSTHTALLICIEELPKAECVHEPGEIGLYDNSSVVERFEDRKIVAVAKCKRCDIELKPKWEPA